MLRGSCDRVHFFYSANQQWSIQTPSLPLVQAVQSSSMLVLFIQVGCFIRICAEVESLTIRILVLSAYFNH